jgi:predicted small lipoprotein YifL
MRNKLLAFSVIAILTVSLMGCGSAKPTTTSTAESSATATTDNTKDLQAQIDKLTKENEDLKKEVATLAASNITSAITATSTTDDSSSSASTISDEVQKYIDNNIVMTGAVVKKYEGYDGTHVGLGGVQLKNKGDKNLSKVEVTVYFQDADGNNIFDQAFDVIGNRYDTYSQAELKANYSFKMEDDYFYTIDNLSDEIDIKKYSVKVTSVDFE